MSWVESCSTTIDHICIVPKKGGESWKQGRGNSSASAPSSSTLSSTFPSRDLTSPSPPPSLSTGSLTEPVSSQEYYRGGSVFVPLTSGQEDVLLMPGLQGGDSVVESSWSFEVSLSASFLCEPKLISISPSTDHPSREVQHRGISQLVVQREISQSPSS